MRKRYLLSYELPRLHVLADYTNYELTIEVITFWGLFKRIEKSNFKVYDNQNLSAFTKNWDELIKNRTPLY